MDYKEVHKLTAIVFTDLVGFTDIMENSEQDGLELLKKQREILFPIVESHHGEILKEMGDGLLLMFDSSIRAVRCAIEIQKTAQDNDISLRIGVHIGDIVVKKKDIIGSGVNIASRIEPLAPAGGICISEDVWRQIRNQKDLYAESIGKRELKGVKHPIEIYELTDSELASRKAKISIIKDIWQRRVPQILALYLGACWAIIEFVTWLTQQYLLSPHLVNLSFITLLSFIPTTILLAYFHGKPGKDEWTRVEKIGIPFNVLFSIFLLVFLFNGKELGSITQTVTAQNEEGETIERVIPKNEFRKNIGIFFFENATQDSTLNWMQYALSYMIKYDLSQDMFLNVKDGYDLYSYFCYSEIPNTSDLSLTLRKRISNRNHCDYFIKGKINIENSEYQISTELYKTKNLTKITSKHYNGKNLFEIVDSISVDIRTDLDIKNNNEYDFIDLPISDVTTKSEIALKEFISSIKFSESNHKTYDYHKLEQSTSIDSNFIQPYLIDLHHLVNIFSRMKPFLSNTQLLKYSNKIKSIFDYLNTRIDRCSEAVQFKYKYYFYIFNNEQENAKFVLKIWRDLYPFDIDAYEFPADLHFYNDEYELAIKDYEKIIEFDPSRYDILLDVGKSYCIHGDVRTGINYYNKYLLEFPNDFEVYIKIGTAYYFEYNYNKAIDYFEKAYIIKSDNYDLLLKIFDSHIRLGNFELAMPYIEQYVNYTHNNNRYLSKLSELHLILGKYTESINISNNLIEYKDELSEIMIKAFHFKNLVYLGDIKSAREHITKIVDRKNNLELDGDEFKSENVLFSAINNSATNIYYSIVLFNFICDTKQYDEIEYDKIKQSLNWFKNYTKEHENEQSHFEVGLLVAKGNLYLIENKFDDALSCFLNALNINPDDTRNLQKLCLTYRKMKDYKNAEKQIKQALKILPASGFSHYEYSLLYQDMGKKKKAIEELNKALEIWKDADPEFIPAQMAREKLSELES